MFDNGIFKRMWLVGLAQDSHWGKDVRKETEGSVEGGQVVLYHGRLHKKYEAF